METKWKITFAFYFLTVASVAAINYYLYGAVFLSAGQIGLSPGEGDNIGSPLALLTWPLFISTTLIILVALIASYILQKPDYSYDSNESHLLNISKKTK